jgi:xanthine dehydrogenase accessory factor
MVLVPLFNRLLVLVRGAGDLGSGVVYRLHQAGFPVVVTELSNPLFVRRTVAYGAAVYEGAVSVDGITARHVPLDAIQDTIQQGEIPVVVDPDGAAIAALKPDVLIDARMEKRPLDTRIDQAGLVIALGPGFEAGVHAHAVIETNRGHFLGRVYWQGNAEPDTGLPGRIAGKTRPRVLRAPSAGYVQPIKTIGDSVAAGDPIAEVGGSMVHTVIGGVVRGMIHHSVLVEEGAKIGDVDPRAERSHCFAISEKALAIGGGVVEAILSSEYVGQVLAGR